MQEALLGPGRGKGALLGGFGCWRAVVVFNLKVQIVVAAFSQGKAALGGNGARNEPGWASG